MWLRGFNINAMDYNNLQAFLCFYVSSVFFHVKAFTIELWTESLWLSAIRQYDNKIDWKTFWLYINCKL